MKFEHWIVSPNDPVVIITEKEQAHPDDSFVAMTMPDSTTGRSIATEQDYANARLIAAAPELLAALEVAEGVVDWALSNGAHPGVRAAHLMILAAINKAKGES